MEPPPKKQRNALAKEITVRVRATTENTGRPTFRGRPSKKDLLNPYHPVRSCGMSLVLPLPLPRCTCLAALQELCRHICLPCGCIACEHHPEGNGLVLEPRGERLRLDATSPDLYRHFCSGPLLDAVKPSLVAERQAIELPTPTPTTVLLPDKPSAQCLWCLDSNVDHGGCASVTPISHPDGCVLQFQDADSAQEWRRRNPQLCSPAVLYVEHMPAWVETRCRCCGLDVPSESMPASVSPNRKVLRFASVQHLERWRNHHRATGKLLRADGLPELRLSAPAAWPADRCSCCGSTPPGGKFIQHTLKNGEFRLVFASPEAADRWRDAHQGVEHLKGPLKSRLVTFAPSELLPLLRRLKDYGDYPALEQLLFTKEYVVRCTDGTPRSETQRVIDKAQELQTHLELAEGKITMRVPYASRSFRMRCRVDPEVARAVVGGPLDDLNRLRAGETVQKGSTLACYSLGTRADEHLTVHHEGVFNLTWTDTSSDGQYLDVAVLQALHVDPAQRQEQNRAVAKLRYDALYGKGQQPKSGTELLARLASGKKVSQAAAGSLRLQAETGAQYYPPDVSKPVVVISTADALFMRVRRPFGKSAGQIREDCLAMLRGHRRWPGATMCVSGAGDEAKYFPLDATGWNPGKMHTDKDLLTEYITHLGGTTFTRQGLVDIMNSTDDKSLAAQITEALHSMENLIHEVAILRCAKWCAKEHVTQLVAHPRTGDRYYVNRNPIDNSGSVLCNPLMVVEGVARGAGYSALLIKRLGMDHDGDASNFIAVLDENSVEIQERSFGPERRLYTESGELAGGPTQWPLERLCSFFEGDKLRLDHKEALHVLSGAGCAASLIPGAEKRALTKYTHGEVVRILPENELAYVVLPGYSINKERTEWRNDCQDAWQEERPPVLKKRPSRARDLRQYRALQAVLHVRECATGRCWRVAPGSVCAPGKAPSLYERSLTEHKPGDVLAWASEPTTVLEVLYVSKEDPPAQIWVESPKGHKLVPRTSVWRAHVRAGDVLACLLEASLPPYQSLILPRDGRLIWQAGYPLWKGARFSFQVPKCAGRGWEVLVLRVLLEHRALRADLAARNWRAEVLADALARRRTKRSLLPALQAAAVLPRGFAVALHRLIDNGETLEECGLGATLPILQNTGRPVKSQRLGTPSAYCPPALCAHVAKRCKLRYDPEDRGAHPPDVEPRWARLVARAMGAEAAGGPLPSDFTALLGDVVRDVGEHSALALATKLQTVGYRLCPTLPARAQEQILPGAQAIVEKCLSALNRVWQAQPPAPYPKMSEEANRVQQCTILSAARKLFSTLAKGFGPTQPCGRCANCRAREIMPPFTARGRQLLKARTDDEFQGALSLSSALPPAQERAFLEATKEAVGTVKQKARKLALLDARLLLATKVSGR